ncbi:armadillo-type protein [Aspergillus unguis]
MAAQTQSIGNPDCPSLNEIFSNPAHSPPAIEPSRAETVPLEEQEALLRIVEEALKQADQDNDSVSFQNVPSLLSKLWHCQSQNLLRATEALANGSRNPSLRHVYGRTGILSFFLRLISSKEDVESNLILHCLRLIGNSCADVDDNRTIVVNENYTSAIIRYSVRPELIQVVIPVVYNLCVDFEPAQTQLAANRIVYILLSLIKEDAFRENDALLEYAYELLELVGEQEKGIENSPDGTVSLLVNTALSQKTGDAPAQFCCLASCLAAYLNNNRFQDVCVLRNMVPDVLSVLKHSLSFGTAGSNEDAQALIQSSLKINQALAELSALPLFAELYPLDSSLSQTLKSWINSPEDQLQICGCVMLGNLARSDEVCVRMVKELRIHEELIAVLNSNARGAALHAALGMLKNMAIAGGNRILIGEAGAIPAVSRLWAFETIPQVQLAATSIVRQLIISSVENINRLLEPAVTPAEEQSNEKQTYLSLLLALFEKTDSTPIKTEIGRITASLCRTLVPKSRAAKQGDSLVDSLLDSLFTRHKGIALPLGAMITQTQWPVVRSEGWFALALMTSIKNGAQAVVLVLQEIDGFSLIEQTLNAEEPASDNQTEKVQWRKDRDNIVVLVQELLKNEPDTVDASWNATMQDLMGRHVSKYMKQDE